MTRCARSIYSLGVLMIQPTAEYQPRAFRRQAVLGQRYDEMGVSQSCVPSGQKSGTCAPPLSLLLHVFSLPFQSSTLNPDLRVKNSATPVSSARATSISINCPSCFASAFTPFRLKVALSSATVAILEFCASMLVISVSFFYSGFIGCWRFFCSAYSGWRRPGSSIRSRLVPGGPSALLALRSLGKIRSCFRFLSLRLFYKVSRFWSFSFPFGLLCFLN